MQSPSNTDSELEQDRARRERDLYRDLLELGVRDAIEPFLAEALALLVRLTGARRGYIELIEDRHADGAPRFHIAQGCYDQEVETIQAELSQGIIAEAIATGRTIVTESAMRDPRFLERRSVRKNRTEAVLCAPIGASPPIGVVYLQDREAPEPFSEDDRRLVEVFARPLAAFADRLLARQHRLDAEDPTVPARRKLQADGIIGRSKALARTLEQIVLVAPLDIGVLILGPPGTGKTQLAHVLHRSGPRAARPFVEQSCANLPAQLLESELFGHEKGAFTGAVAGRKGRVAAAEGGTLFLDEVAELPLSAQAGLLQLLQSKQYRPLGNSTRLVTADVRIVAATNADLKDRVARQTFRDDLYWRLDVLPVRVPSLAERIEDVVPLAEHICERTAVTQRLPLLTLSPGARRALEAAEWPGNVRQLYNRVQEAMIRAAAEHAPTIERRHLFRDEEPGPRSDELSLEEATRHFRKQLVERRLRETGWSIAKTAQRLEISRSQMYNLINEFDLRDEKKL